MTTLDRLLSLARTAAAAGDPVTPFAVRAVYHAAYAGDLASPREVAPALLWLQYIQGRFLSAQRITAPRVCA